MNAKSRVRIGPKMRRVLYLADCPGGIAAIDAARAVGPHGSLGYGYAAVNRVIAAGLVVVGRAQEQGRRGMLLATTDY